MAMRGRRAGYGTVRAAATKRAVYWCIKSKKLTGGMKLTALDVAKGGNKLAGELEEMPRGGLSPPGPSFH
jgi:hypothetical protein